MEEFGAREQLAYIKNIMEETRREMGGYGGDFILWGILMIVGLVVTYLHVVFRLYGPWTWVVWFVLVGTGWLLSIISFMKSKNRRGTSHFTAIACRIWAGYGVAATILGFIGPMSGAYPPDYIVAVVAAVMGAAYLGTGLLFGSRWLQGFAIGWWGGSIVMFYNPTAVMLLVFAAMMFCFQVVPGYFIYRRNKIKTATQE